MFFIFQKLNFHFLSFIRSESRILSLDPVARTFIVSHYNVEGFSQLVTWGSMDRFPDTPTGRLNARSAVRAVFSYAG